MTVAPSPPVRATNEKIEVDVGLYLSNEFKTRTFSKRWGGDKFNYPNLGEASATQFHLALAEIFRTVELVEERPSFAKPRSPRLHAVVEPSIEDFDFDVSVVETIVPLTRYKRGKGLTNTWRVRIAYKITVYDVMGNVVLSETVEGIGYATASYPLGGGAFESGRDARNAASQAIEEGVKRAVEVLAASAQRLMRG